MDVAVRDATVAWRYERGGWAVRVEMAGAESTGGRS